MVRREPHLVIFTTFTQMAVGGFLIWAVGNCLLPEISAGTGSVYPSLLLGAILGFLLIGLLAAVLHLGRLSRVVHIFHNIGNSWLSREALWGAVFGFNVLILMVIYQLGWDSLVFRVLVVSLGVISGIGLVFGISRLYMLRTVPAWDHLGTPAQFATTSLLLGWIMNIVIWIISFTFSSKHINDPMAVRFLEISVISVLILVSVQFALQFLVVWYLGSQGEKGVESLEILWCKSRTKLIVRWLLALLGILSLIWSRGEIVESFGPASWGFALSGVLLLVSEILGRSIFYSMYRREGF